MLNTKPIKKKVINEMDNSDIKKALGTDGNTQYKTLETNDSMSSKDIIKLHNENLNVQKENTKVMEDMTKQREMNILVNKREELQEDQNNIMNNKPSLYPTNDNNINNTNNTMCGDNNHIIRELANQIKNELNPNPQVIFVAPRPNLADTMTENFTKSKKRNNYAEWDEDKNAYVVHDNNEIEGFFTNNDIIKSIINGTNINRNIKKYFFIIAYNKETDTNEFNFIDGIFTDNLEIMIRVQNSLFDLSNQSELFEENENYSENLLIFNYQFIIYLFKKSNYLNDNHTNKIAKFYSTITYRFTSLVLKQTMKIENENITLANDIEKLLDIKNDISLQLTNIEKHLAINNKPIKKNTNDSLNIINITSSENNTNTDTDTNTDSKNETDDTDNTDNTDNKDSDDKTQKVGSVIKNKTKSILDDIITSLSSKNKIDELYDSEENGYKEINDDVTSYMDKQVSSSIKSSNISKTSNTNNTTSTKYKIIKKHVSTTDPSYNKSSAINNGKIYKIKL